MNNYINTLKGNLEGFYTYVRSAKAYLEEDRRKYSAEVFEECKKAYTDKKNASYEKFRKQCTDEFSKIRKIISRASMVDPETMQSATYKMFTDASIELSAAEAEVYIAQANANHDFTMLRAIKQYVDKHDNMYFEIPLAEDVLKTYKEFFDSALRTAALIYENDSVSCEDYVKYFADEEFAQYLYNTIGNSVFKDSNACVAVNEHRFDNINLELGESNSNWGIV